MALIDPDNTYGWHDEHASWSEIKVALVLAGTVALGLILLL
jgi:hypothetical protein